MRTGAGAGSAGSVVRAVAVVGVLVVGGMLVLRQHPGPAGPLPGAAAPVEPPRVTVDGGGSGPVAEPLVAVGPVAVDEVTGTDGGTDGGTGGGTDGGTGGGTDGGTGGGTDGTTGDATGAGTPSRARLLTEVVARTNRERLAAGCSRLTWDDTLAVAAQRHGEDLVRRDYFEHVSPDGSTPQQRAAALGYRGGVGENLAVGYDSGAVVVDAWMHSPGHRANILDCAFSRIGVGYLDATIASAGATGVWVQEFGTTAGPGRPDDG